MTRFLAGSYNILIYRLRYVLTAIFVIIGIIAAGIASQMGPLSKGEEMMSYDHPLVVTQNVMLDDFDTGLGTPSTLSVQITWGVKEMDTSNIKEWDATDLGVLVWDDTFTVAPAAN